MTIVITEEECVKLVKLHRNAQTTPVIALSLADGLSSNDWASRAWCRVTDFQKMLGAKYGYNYMENAINTKTREVIPIKK